MDRFLSITLVHEDLTAAEKQATSLGLELVHDQEERLVVYISGRVGPQRDLYVARLHCLDYDEKPPALDFANPENLKECGRRWWPRIEGVPIAWVGEVPVFCTPGTRGYHEHPSHVNESHPKSVWKLPRVVFLIWKLMYRTGNYQGRGL